MALVQKESSRRSRFPELGDNLFQVPEVLGERAAPGVGQDTGGLWPSFAGGLGKGDEPGFLEDPKVGSQIPVGHDQQVPQVGVGQGRGCRKGGNDRQAGLFVDDPIQMRKRFRVHAVGLFSVQRK